MLKNIRLSVLFIFVTFLSSHLLADMTIKETCQNGFSLEAHLGDDFRIKNIQFSDGSGIKYEYTNDQLSRIIRYDQTGTELYTQSYQWNGSRLMSQTGWYTTIYIYDQTNGRLVAKLNPWLEETIQYDSLNNPIRIGDTWYSYDDQLQISRENQFCLANIVKLNEKILECDQENKIKGYKYDSRGNLLTYGIQYGNNNLISEAFGEKYSYDTYGRWIQKGNVSYLYLGCEEIGSFENGECKTLKIPGVGGPVAIEIDGKPYVPITDSAGIIRKLIDPTTHLVFQQNDCSIFGEKLTSAIPYAYRGKRYDPLTNLIYFGRRFYDPALHRWTSPDPLGPIDHSNLYQYVYNNPLKYCDPTGGSFWGYVLGIGEVVAGGALMAGGAVLEVATMGGFTFGFMAVEGSGLALMTDGLARTTREARDIQIPKNYKINKTKAPPYQGDQLNTDPKQPPIKGFEWKGKGPPGSKQGSWYNPSTGESLHPDFDHPYPIKPHWDYVGPGFPSGARIFPDGTWEIK